MGSRNNGRTIVISANSLWNILNFRKRLVRELQDAGYDVVVVCPGGEPGELLPAELGRLRPLRIESDGLNPISDASSFLSYFRIFRELRPAALLSFTAKPNIYGALAASLCGVPPIPNVSGLGTAFIRGGALRWLLSRLYRLAFRRAPVVFFQNGDDRDLFIAGRMVRPEQARLLPGSGVDLRHFEPVRNVETANGCVFLFVGRLLGDKGVREFVEAARIVKAVRPECRFQLLGFVGAANRSAISPAELAAWQAEGTIEYLGSADDVRPHLARADAVVLPSYREGLPRSLLEAAAMGRPLIASDVPGNREVVRAGVNGLLCEVRSARSLAETFEMFAGLPASEKERMGNESRKMVEERFSEEKVITAYLEIVRVLAADDRVKGEARP